MADCNSLDWLPTGWNMHVTICNSRKTKCYIEPVTNRKFYSKPEVLRYLKLGSSTSITNVSEDDNPYELHRLEDCSQCNENEKPGWLPRGWTMVLTPPRRSLLNSKKQKFVIDPLTGWKFFGTPAVISYLSGNCGHSEPELEKRTDGSKTDMISLQPGSSENLETMKENNILSETENTNKNVYIERKKVDGLPPGWIKEIKVTINTRAVRRDPYYTDPVSGYVFRSKKDALRYLATGDIYQCAMIPKKRDELKWLPAETSVVNAEDINSTKLKDSPNQGTKMRKTFTSEQNEIILDEASGEKIEVVQETPNNLPPGWIKEIKIQFKTNAIVRRDPYYTDPVSEYVFRSEKDALRYLKTGDIRSCSIKPKKRNELGWLKGETTPPPTTPTTDIWKSSHQTKTKKRQPLFPDLPCRSSKRLLALKSIEDSHQNHQGSKKNDNAVEKVVEYVGSDPCIDFAYKTLTGSISMENDTTIKSILQEGSTSILPMDDILKSPTNNPP